MRALSPDDMDRVVELHREGFGGDAHKEDLEGFLRSVFFEHPWEADRYPSLAYVDKNGRITGCIGIMPRPMLLDDQRVQAIITHNFVVSPGQRGGMAAIQLMRAAMSTEPDLTLSDSNETATKLAKALGARTLDARSQRWFRVLRPAGLGVYLAEKSLSGRIPTSMNRVLAGLSTAPDAVARALPGSPVRVSRVDGPDPAIDAVSLAELIDRTTTGMTLRPVYTAETLGWLLDTLGRTRQKQSLRVRVVGKDGQAVGWYVYYSRPGGVGRVLQLGASAGAQRRVLDHLFADALGAGDVALSGQSDPAWTTALKDASCRTRPGSTSLLLNTSHPRVAQALDTPDAFLSRLEGEAWLHFGY